MSVYMATGAIYWERLSEKLEWLSHQIEFDQERMSQENAPPYSGLFLQIIIQNIFLEQAAIFRNHTMEY